MNKTLVFKFFGFAVMVCMMIVTTGCGGGGSSGTGGTGGTGGTVTDMKITNFGPSQTTKNVTFSAATLDATLKDDLPVTKMASISLKGNGRVNK